MLFIGFRCAWGSWLWPTCLCVSDYSDSSEVKFEELKNVKLEEEDEEEEEEQEAAALDLSVNPASLGGRLVLSGSKKKSSSSLGSGSSRDSISSDSETSEPLSCRAQGQSGVLTVHSYAKGDGRVTVGEPCTRKKGGATGSISERELTEVRALGNAPWLGSCGGGRLLGAWGCLLQVSKMAGERASEWASSLQCQAESWVALVHFHFVLCWEFLFPCPCVTVRENPGVLMTTADLQVLDTPANPTCSRGMRVSVAVVAVLCSLWVQMQWLFLPENSRFFSLKSRQPCSHPWEFSLSSPPPHIFFSQYNSIDGASFRRPG